MYSIFKKLSAKFRCDNSDLRVLCTVKANLSCLLLYTTRLYCKTMRWSNPRVVSRRKPPSIGISSANFSGNDGLSYVLEAASGCWIVQLCSGEKNPDMERLRCNIYTWIRGNYKRYMRETDLNMRDFACLLNVNSFLCCMNCFFFRKASLAPWYPRMLP